MPLSLLKTAQGHPMVRTWSSSSSFILFCNLLIFLDLFRFGFHQSVCLFDDLCCCLVDGEAGGAKERGDV